MSNCNQLKTRILDISYKHGLSHLSATLTSVEIIHHLFRHSDPDDFILSCGHAGLALYVCLEDYYGKELCDAEEMLLTHGIHPNRDPGRHCIASSGSLGHGVGISIGLAISNPHRSFHCLVSDGECDEGSTWEAIRVANRLDLDNLTIDINFNGNSAYSSTYIGNLPVYENCEVHDTTVNYALLTEGMPQLHGYSGHYHILNGSEHSRLVERLRV